MSLVITHAIPVYAPAWQFGGPVLSVSRLCEGLAAQGHEVKVITTNAGLPDLPSEQLGHPIQRHGVEVTYFPVDQPNGTIRSRALNKALPRLLQGSDLLHLSAIWQPLGIPIQREAWRQGIPVLHSLRGALGPYSRQQGWWKKVPYYFLQERPWLQRAAGLHVTTRQEERELNGLGLRAPRHLLSNPIDLECLGPNPKVGAELRTQLGIDSHRPLMLICGRQHHKKGLDLLPSVLSRMQSQPWQLLLVGRDEDGSGDALLTALRNAGLGGRVHSLGTQPAAALSAIYNAADLLLLPSRHENFGNVVIEALACGCAVAISEQTGVAEDLLSDAPPGFGAVLPRRSEDWSTWLTAWLSAPRRAGDSGAQWAAERYSIPAISNRALEVYRNILQNSSDQSFLE